MRAPVPAPAASQSATIAGRRHRPARRVRALDRRRGLWRLGCRAALAHSELRSEQLGAHERGAGGGVVLSASE